MAVSSGRAISILLARWTGNKVSHIVVPLFQRFSYKVRFQMVFPESFDLMFTN